MKPEELTYLGTDPGAVKHGNFINYYTFHAAKERIEKLNREMFPSIVEGPVVCLDIGCNTGELSIEFHKYLKETYPKNEIKMLAVDIDANLIDRAKATNTDSTITFIAADILSNAGEEVIKQYLHESGKDRFDVTFCFSVTMWIHLNNGDDGLLQFINSIKQISRTILLESQPWQCYRNAQRRLKKQGNYFPHYHTLKIKGNDVNKVIENIMSEFTHRKVYESTDTSWKRKIECFELLQ